MNEPLKGILKDLEPGIQIAINLYKKTNSVTFIDSTIDELNIIYDDIEDVEFRSCIKEIIDDLNKLKSK